jgi:hypothetical protein
MLARPLAEDQLVLSLVPEAETLAVLLGEFLGVVFFGAVGGKVAEFVRHVVSGIHRRRSGRYQ